MHPQPIGAGKGNAAVPPARIMVVDDHPSNVLLLEEMLKLKGHQVRPFTSSREALASAQADPPDLILLDINMPELDGYQTCQLLKQNPASAAVPVIFLSALSQTAHKVEAFRSGGVDYITKPFEFAEVHARVETHLRLHYLQSCLRDQNVLLDSVVQARTRELAEAHRQLALLDRAKSDFLHMISHELRTPLNGLLGAASLLLAQAPPTAEAAELAAILAESQERILSLVDSALLLTQLAIGRGKFPPDSVPLAELLAKAIARLAPLLDARRASIAIPPGPLSSIAGERDLLVRAFQALLSTALRFSSAGDTVIVTSAEMWRAVVIEIDIPTGALPPPAIAGFFELFGINESSTSAGDLALEPVIASRILGLFGGLAAVENRAPAGIRITVRCPRA